MFSIEDIELTFVNGSATKEENELVSKAEKLHDSYIKAKPLIYC